MDRLNKVNEDPRFQSYMSAEEDDRKIKNSIKREYYDKGVVEGKEQGFDNAKKIITQIMSEEGISSDILSRITELSSDNDENPRFQSYISAEENDRKIKNSIKREYYDKGVVEGVRASANKLIESGISIEEVCKILDISEDDLR